MKAPIEIQNILQELLSSGYETEVVEFKEAKNQYDFDKLGKYFSALCNEANLKGKRPAWLVFGIRDKDNLEKDYEHFTCPLLLNTEKVHQKIRNLKYRYIADDSLFPEEVDQYDPYIIREALNNCIAHQDYTLGGKINIVEHEDGKLTFINAGHFIPQSVEQVVISDAPEPTYRNPFLVEAMINLNMIDAIGSGIKRMFLIQKNKFFPLPDYDIEQNKVRMTITGKVVDMNYARKLATMPKLQLEDIISLDKVAKSKPLTDNEIKQLKAKKVIEGRKPNFHISASVANVTDEKSEYIKLKGFDENYYCDLIYKYLKQFRKAKKSDFKQLLMDKLPSVLDDNQKEHKIKNLLQKMKTEKRIKIDEERFWTLDEI